MKNRILLMFLAVGGLLLCSNSSQAAIPTDVTSLSRTISELSNLPANHQSQVAAAIKRALIVKEITTNHELLNRSFTESTTEKESSPQTNSTRTPGTINTNDYPSTRYRQPTSTESKPGTRYSTGAGVSQSIDGDTSKPASTNARQVQPRGR
jgi:hypothetical protein